MSGYRDGYRDGFLAAVEIAAAGANGVEPDLLKGMSEHYVSIYCTARRDASDFIKSIPHQACDYCGPGKLTGLPGNACESCANTGLRFPDLAGVAEQSGAGAPETSVRCGAPAATIPCEDCPPAGYPTDKTRCDPCPRKACDHDWHIWPETDGQIQHCLKCKANRKTQIDIEECGNHSAGSPP